MHTWGTLAEPWRLSMLWQCQKEPSVPTPVT